MITTKKVSPSIKSFAEMEIDNFQLSFCLCLKANPSAKPFIWKLVLFTRKCLVIYTWIKLIFIWKASHEDSLWNRGERQLGRNRDISPFPMWLHKILFFLQFSMLTLTCVNWSESRARTTRARYVWIFICVAFMLQCSLIYCCLFSILEANTPLPPTPKKTANQPTNQIIIIKKKQKNGKQALHCMTDVQTTILGAVYLS